MKSYNLSYLLLLIFILTTSCATKGVQVDEVKAKNKKEEQVDLSVSNYTAYYHYSLSKLHFFRRDFRSALSEARIAEQIDTKSAPLKYNLAIVLMTLNRFTEALIMLEESIKLNPDYEPAHKILGRIYASSTDPKKRKEALDKLNKSAKYDPKDSETYMFLGIVQSEQNNYEEAISNFKKFIQISPRDERGYYFLGRIYFQTDRLQKAEENFRRAVDLNPDYVSALIDLALIYEKRGILAESEGLYKLLVSKFPNNIDVFMRYGNFLYRTNRKSDASKQYETAGKLDSDNTNLKLRLVLLYIDNKNYDKAIQDLKLILLGDPENEKAKYYLALSYIETDNFEQALDLLDSISTDSKLYNDVLIQKSYLYEKKGEVAKSIVIIEEAYKSDTENEPIVNYLGSLYRKNKEYDKAIDLYKKYMENHPQSESILYSLGVTYYLDKQEDDSISTMKEILKMNPEHVEALNFIGYSYAEMGKNLDEAEKFVNKALEISPNKGYIIDSLGWIYYKKGRLEEALELLLKAATLTSNDPEVMEHIGDVYKFKGEFKKALDYYKRGFEIADGVDEDVANKLKNKAEQTEHKINELNATKSS